jgi:hypothetical protein
MTITRVIVCGIAPVIARALTIARRRLTIVSTSHRSRRRRATSDERRATERIDGDAVPEVRDDDDDDDDGQRTNRIESNRIDRRASSRSSDRNDDETTLARRRDGDGRARGRATGRDRWMKTRTRGLTRKPPRSRAQLQDDDADDGVRGATPTNDGETTTPRARG